VASTDERRDLLDSLRFLAIMAVLVDHYVQAGSFQPGAVGVCFFLLLSGFLITRTLARNLSPSRQDKWLLLKSFYGRRALRIWPLYYLLLLALVAAGSLATTKALVHAAFLTNFYAAWLNSWDVPWFLAHVWTLCVQEQYYLLWPLLFIVLSPRLRMLLLAAMLALSLIFRAGMWHAGLANHVAMFSLPPASFDALAIGSLLALAHDRLVPYLRRTFQALALFLALYLASRSMSDDFFKVAILPTLWLLPLGVLTLSAFENRLGALGRILKQKFLVFFGRISLAIYLLHVPVWMALVTWGPSWLAPYLAPSWRAFALLTPATLIAATFSWFFFEKPLQKLRKFLPYPDPNNRRGVGQQSAAAGAIQLSHS
jgi:peptidoglycan/LPS O-acetylase OafA/YrhL